LWPDFTAEDLRAAITNFRGRERRFGGVGAAAASPPMAIPARRAQ
jgi:undecaprenyl diphosphate synthase